MIDPAKVEKYRKAQRLASRTDNPDERSTAEGILAGMRAEYPGIEEAAVAAERVERLRAAASEVGFDPKAKPPKGTRYSPPDWVSMIQGLVDVLPPGADPTDLHGVIDAVFTSKPGAPKTEKVATAVWRRILHKAVDRGDIASLLRRFDPFARKEPPMSGARGRTPRKPKKTILDRLQAAAVCDGGVEEDEAGREQVTMTITLPVKLWRKVVDEETGASDFVDWLEEQLTAEDEDVEDSSSEVEDVEDEESR